MRERRIGKVCQHCKQWRVSWAKGLCQKCYLAHGENYPALPPQNQHTAERHDPHALENMEMPETVYAVVRVIQSPLSGKLRVMVGWFRKREDARHIAEKCCRHFSCRVERWIRISNRKRPADRPRRYRRRRGTMSYETVAVYPRRGGKRVAA